MKSTIIPIDLTYFYSITEGNKEFGDTLLKSAMDDIDAIVARLEKSWTNQDESGLKQAAHSLISLSAIAGMPLVEKWCRQIENTIAAGGPHIETGDIVASIVAGWPQASLELQTVINSQMSTV